MTKHSLSPTVRALLATSAFYMMAVPAQAADATSSSVLKSADFSQIDTNRDGYVDAKEAAALPELSGIMKSADKDRDGKLSPSEFHTGITGGLGDANPARTAPGVGTGATSGGDK